MGRYFKILKLMSPFHVYSVGSNRNSLKENCIPRKWNSGSQTIWLSEFALRNWNKKCENSVGAQFEWTSSSLRAAVHCCNLPWVDAARSRPDDNNYTQQNSSWFCPHWRGAPQWNGANPKETKKRRWGSGRGWGSRGGGTFGKLLRNINSATFYC